MAVCQDPGQDVALSPRKGHQSEWSPVPGQKNEDMILLGRPSRALLGPRPHHYTGGGGREGGGGASPLGLTEPRPVLQDDPRYQDAIRQKQDREEHLESKHKDRLTAEQLATLDSQTPATEERLKEGQFHQGHAPDRGGREANHGEKEARQQHSVPQRDQAGARAEEFVVHVAKPTEGPKRPVGLQVRELEGKTLRVADVAEGSLVHDWNLTQPSFQVKKACTILEVNGIRNDSQAMLEQIKTSRELTMHVRQKIRDGYQQ